VEPSISVRSKDDSLTIFVPACGPGGRIVTKMMIKDSKIYVAVVWNTFQITE
jgi:hypothetical protein